MRGQRLAGMKKGKRILILGAGLAGLLHVKVAKYLGAKSIIATDVDSYRLESAEKSGATAVHAKENIPERVKEITKGHLADLVIVCSGAQAALESGLRSVARGGTVLLFSAAEKDSHLPVNTNDIFWRSEVSILSSYAAAPEDLKQALDLIAKKKVNVRDMITHRLPLTDIQKGFDLVVKPQHSMKVIIEPHKERR